uniref:Uncharacterized protein n=1 Tax=Nonomuraea gerenzanensis TaxID=93944 RepID=A0A1M4EPD6_9ACTN|nr:hypothetical protein BN4615_P10237 [Nonomuraea gerenzanensis]
MRDHADPADLALLVRAHAHLSHTLGLTLRTDPPPDKLDPATALHRWQHLDTRLRTLLTLAPETSHPSHRVAVIGANRLFPPEWRQAAWTTLLPDDLTEWSSRWRRWYAAITTGRFHHYLARLRTWDTAHDLAAAQADLTAAAHATEARTNAWTREPAFIQARHLVHTLPPPPSPPAPGPPPADDAPPPGQRTDEEAVAGHLALLRQTAREFSRTVPAPFKRTIRPPQGHPLPDPWLESFFDWLEPVVRSRHALYLWA